MLEGLRGEQSIAELCRREGIATSLYYSWSEEFLEAGKRRLAGDTARQASSPEVKELRAEATALEDRRPPPGRVWNRIPDVVREAVVDLALEKPELSPRALAVEFTDTKRHFVSEASVYRILKAQDLIASPDYVVIKGEPLSATGPRTVSERRVPGQDHTAEPTLANGLHLSKGRGLGLVLPQHRPR